MSQYGSTMEPGHYDPYGDAEPRKSWFGRHWFWFIPTIVLAPIFCCCGGGALLIWWSIGYVMDIPAYKDSVALAQQSAEVQNALGTPVDAPEGFMDLVGIVQGGGQFDFNQVNNTIQFVCDVPISGPNGSASLQVQGESQDGGQTWTYTTQQVTLPDGSVIDLLSPGSVVTPPDDASDEAEAPEDSGREIPDQE